jgi:hypothetical protein
MAALQRTASIPFQEAAQLFRAETMTNLWAGPNVDNKLRSDLEKAALALAKAGHTMTGDAGHLEYTNTCEKGRYQCRLDA